MRIKELENHHFSDEATTEADQLLGAQLATVIGDTFTSESDSPIQQWTQIVKALRVHGLKITEFCKVIY
jgi:hypothetical protein